LSTVGIYTVDKGRIARGITPTAVAKDETVGPDIVAEKIRTVAVLLYEENVKVPDFVNGPVKVALTFVVGIVTDVSDGLI
jgi:hypothetical protein